MAPILIVLQSLILHTVLSAKESSTCETDHQEQCVTIDTTNMYTELRNWFETFNSHLKHDQLDLLPIDPIVIDPSSNHVPRQVPNALFSKVNPEPMSNLKLVSISQETFEQTLHIRFPPNITPNIYHIFSQILNGNTSVITQYIPNMVPYAHCYGGHQFGYFSGQLGDGRAVSLGEYHTDNGGIWELQLKGSGKTPFSRKGDGRAVLRSSIREYLMSEHMYYLGIPTSRALMIITSTTDTVHRDIYYNGNIQSEAIAIVLRTAPNWIRFGSFELHIGKNGRYGPNYAASYDSKRYLTKSLLDHVIEYHYNDIWEQYKDELMDGNMYEYWWKELVLKNIKLVMKWMCIGFVHGVLNTDNMSILGIGIDYGPFGIMEYYHDDYVPNYSDNEARYSYSKQVEIFKWNLGILSESLAEVGLLPLSVTRKYLGKYFDGIYEEYYVNEMKQKFGLIYNEDITALKLLFDIFFDALRMSVCDMTNSFRYLNTISIYGINACYDCEEYDEDMMQKYRKMEENRLVEYLVKQCVSPSHYRSLQKRRSMIRTHNIFDIKVVDNEWIAHMDESEKREYDTKIWSSFVALYRRKYADKEWDIYKATMSQWEFESKKITQHIKELNDRRIQMMNAINPKYILRNYILQQAIESAEKGDYSQIETIKSIMMKPFSDNVEYDGTFDKPVAEQSCDTFGSCDMLSCSS